MKKNKINSKFKKKINFYIPIVHSQCESKYVSTGPEACLAPMRRARMRPSRLAALIIFTFGYIAMYSSSCCFK